MGLLCVLRDPRLSRFVDGELPLLEYREVQAHLRSCQRCARRVGAFRDLDRLLEQADEPVGSRSSRGSALLWVAAAAAVLASVAANLLLREPRPPAPELVLAVPLAPSETLTALYLRIADTGMRR